MFGFLFLYHHNILKHFDLRYSPSKIQMLPYTIVKKFEIGKAFFLFKSISELVLFLDCELSLRFEV